MRDERKIAGAWLVDARVVRKSAQFELELSLRRGGAEPAHRRLRAAGCTALAEATAVFVALAIDSHPVAAGSSAVATVEPESVPTEPVPAEPMPAEPTPASGAGANASEPASRASAAGGPASTRAPDSPAEHGASRPPRQTSDESVARAAPAADGGGDQPLRAGVGLGIGVRFDAGMLPTPRSGFQARVELRLSRVRAALGVTWLPPLETVADTYPAASIRGSGILGDGVLGYALLEGRFSVLPCAVFEYGALSLAGRRIAVPDDQRVGWAAAGAGVRASYGLGAGFELGFEAAGVAPFSRPRLWLRTARGDVTLFHAAAVAVRVAAAIAYVFE